MLYLGRVGVVLNAKLLGRILLIKCQSWGRLNPPPRRANSSPEGEVGCRGKVGNFGASAWSSSRVAIPRVVQKDVSFHDFSSPPRAKVYLIVAPLEMP